MSGANSVRPWACTKCGAAAGEPCRSLTTGRVTDTHVDRLGWDGVLAGYNDSPPASPSCQHFGHEPGEWHYACCACSGMPNGCDNCTTEK